MKKTLTIVALSFAVILTGNSQDIKNDTLDHEAVIITSSKLPEQLRESSKNVEVISREVIARSQGKDLSQILTEHVGINVNGAVSNPTKERSLYMRGAGNGYTIILLNGIPLTDPSGITSPLDLRLIPTADIERIEILKGNQSTLYGSNAIAGVINIITKSEADKFNLNASQSAGSFGTFKSTVNMKIPVSIVTFNQSGQWEKSKGFSEAIDVSGTDNFDKDGMENIQYQASIDVKPMANFSVSPFFRYTSFNGDYDGGSFTDAANTYTSKSKVYGMDGMYTGDAFAVQFNYQRTLPERTYIDTWGENTYSGFTDHLELFGRGSLGEKGKLIGGLAYQSFQVEGIEETSTLLSPYLLMHVTLGAFSGDMGVRYNLHNEFGNAHTYSINPSYRITENSKLFLSYGTGFKVPTMSELYGMWGANINLKPEKSNSFEFGIKGSLMEDKFSYGATYFNRKIEDVIIYNFVSGYLNSDLQHDKGLELNLDYQASSLFNVGIQYEYLDGEITPGDNTIDPYFNLYRRPKHRIASAITYNHEDLGLLTFRINYTDQRTDLFYNAVTWMTEEATLDSFFYAQIYGQYNFRWDKLKAFVDVKNLFNTDFQEVYGYQTPGINFKLGVVVEL